MSSLSISLPDSIWERVKTFAREDGVSVDDFVATVLSQCVAVAEADSYIRRRASRGSTQQMLEILSQAPRVEPESFDRFDPTTKG